MYSFPNLEPICCSMSASIYCFLTCIQVSQEAGQVAWYSHLFMNFPQFVMIHTVRGFGIVNKAKVDIFLELSCFLYDPTDVCNLISGSSGFSKPSFNNWNFMVHILLKPGLENFEHYFASMWNECNCAVVWAFFGIAFLWDWNENWKYLEGWTLIKIWKESASYFTWVFGGIQFLALEELKLQSLAGCQLRATQLLGASLQS